jgi:hypothetical protein
VAVEKLVAPKFAKTRSRQDALQTTFSFFLDIFYPQFWPFGAKSDFFNSHAWLQKLSA